MMNAALGALAWGLAGCLAMGQALASPGTVVRTSDELACGPLKAQVRSVWLTFTGDDSPPGQLLEQSLSLSVDGGPARAVPLDGRPQRKQLAGRRRVLDAALTSWACVDGGKSPPYLLLAYACTEGEERGGCAGAAREWDRLYDSRGKHLTAGLKRQDPRRAKVDRAQGLEEVMRGGVPLTGLSR